jgi:hypothetical protein
MPIESKVEKKEKINFINGIEFTLRDNADIVALAIEAAICCLRQQNL